MTGVDFKSVDLDFFFFYLPVGKGYTLKEFKDLEKAGLYAKLPQFTLTLHSAIPKERHKASARSVISRAHRKCR